MRTTYKLNITDMRGASHVSVPHHLKYTSVDAAIAGIVALQLPYQHSCTVHEYEDGVLTKWYGVNMQTKKIATSGVVR